MTASAPALPLVPSDEETAIRAALAGICGRHGMR
jgi:hypothetical protein